MSTCGKTGPNEVDTETNKASHEPTAGPHIGNFPAIVGSQRQRWSALNIQTDEWVELLALSAIGSRRGKFRAYNANAYRNARSQPPKRLSIEAAGIRPVEASEGYGLIAHPNLKCAIAPPDARVTLGKHLAFNEGELLAGELPWGIENENRDEEIGAKYDEREATDNRLHWCWSHRCRRLLLEGFYGITGHDVALMANGRRLKLFIEKDFQV